MIPIDPTPSQIRAACERIQRTWSPETRFKREHGFLEVSKIPRYEIPQMVKVVTNES